MERSKLIPESRHVVKEFPGVRALDDASMDFYEGEVVTLVRENGTGKSTLMKILSGTYTRDGGDIVLDGRPLPKQYSTLEAGGFGVAIIYQELSLMSEMSVMGNVYVSHESRKVGNLIDFKKMYADTKKQLAKLNAGHIDPRGRVGDLPLPGKQMVEITKTLTVDCKVLTMDEPATSLTHEGSEQLFEIIGTLKARGITTICMSHRLDEILRICDRVIVMRDGKLVGSSDVRTSTPDDIIIMMSGKVPNQPVGGGRTKRDKAKSIPLLELEHITDGGFIQGLNLTAYQGEVLGIRGLVGSKRTKLTRMVYGADPSKDGVIKVPRKARQIMNARQTISAGLRYLSESRREDDLSLELKIEENTIHCDMTAVSRRGFISWKKVREISDNYMKVLKTKGTSAIQVINLSEGNQRKVAIAKWLHAGCSLLIFDEPTRGVNMATKTEIHQLIRNFTAQEGRAANVISSEADELVSVSGRIIVMSKGQVTGKLETEETGQNNVFRHITTKGG